MHEWWKQGVDVHCQTGYVFDNNHGQSIQLDHGCAWQGVKHALCLDTVSRHVRMMNAKWGSDRRRYSGYVTIVPSKLILCKD